MALDLKYDFLADAFTQFETVETPKVEINLPLMDKPLDISDWATRVTDTGIPIIKPLNDRWAVNNPALLEVTNYSTNEGMTGNKKEAYNFFISKGLKPHQAAGIVGNLYHESSGLKTGAKGDGGKAFGIAQWHPDRQVGLKALAKAKGTSITDFNTQLEYVWQELNSTENKALQALLNSNTVEQATTNFSKFYERPNPKFENLPSRLKFAKSCLS